LLLQAEKDARSSRHEDLDSNFGKALAARVDVAWHFQFASFDAAPFDEAAEGEAAGGLVDHALYSHSLTQNALHGLFFVIAVDWHGGEPIRGTLMKFAANRTFSFQQRDHGQWLSRLIESSHLQKNRIVHPLS